MDRAMELVARGACVLAGALLLSSCADDPFDFGGPRSCSIVDQNEYVYSLMQRAYLFADEVAIDVDPSVYESPAELIGDVRVAPDRWSRVSDLAKTEALYKEGMFVGLGYRALRDDAGELVISSVHAGSPAALAGLRRGDRIREVGGLRITEIDEEDRWGEVYGADEPGVAVDLLVQPKSGAAEVEVSLVKDWIEMRTVPHDDVIELDGRPVGYVIFSSFVSPADAALDAAFERIRESGAREVVVDLRYNGGGLLSVASHLVSLLVGDVADGDVAYRVEYNDQFAGENTDRRIDRRDGSIRDVEHVVFVTSGSTLSASELVINAVRAHTKVTVVGDLTGGKPVGSRHFELCDKIAVPITFEVLNADGEGRYFDGIPADCAAPDDLGHELGDPEEGSLAAALAILGGAGCPAPAEPPEGEEASAGAEPGFRSGPARGAFPPIRRDAPVELDGEI
jgi:carboxyl-terminal processing protease